MKEFHPPIILTTDTGEVFYEERARHVRVDNSRQRGRSVPAKDRLLTIVCGSDNPPHVFGDVVRVGNDDVLLLDGFTVNRSAAPSAPSPIGYGCVCGDRHPVSFSRVWELVDVLRWRPSKARRVEVASVS